MVEYVYYVNKDGLPIGEVSEKLAAHNANTKLHAAFSCYVFNEKGEFLVTQRAHTKKVWPSVWTNSCCGHPAPGESREDAIMRRLKEELGMTAKEVRVVLPRYVYKTPPYNGIIEHEFCPVFVAIATSNPEPNPEEVAEFKWVDWQWYVDELDNDLDEISKWSWWCKDQLKQLKRSETFHNFLNSL